MDPGWPHQDRSINAVNDAHRRLFTEYIESELAHDRYNEEVDSRHARMIWTHPGMDTWCRNARGRVVANSPWRIVDYWSMTREPAWEDLSAEPAAARAAVGQR